MSMDEYLKTYGYSDRQLPEIAGKYEGKNAIVVADGHTVWQDLIDLGCQSYNGRGQVVAPENHHFMVVNGAGMYFPGEITHWYSNEPLVMQKFIAARRNEYRREFKNKWITHSNHMGAHHKWPFGGHGTSGLGAVLVSLGLGYKNVIICGMPLDNGPHNGEPPWRSCRFESAEAADQKNGALPMHWKRAIDLAFDGRVSAMSGRPRKWLGGPKIAG